MNKKIIMGVVLLAGSMATTVCSAQQVHSEATLLESDRLAVCLADSTTGKDRKDMARWVFIGMAAHPEIASLSNVKPADIAQANQKIANIFVRLLTVDCKKEAQQALDSTTGRQSFHEAFSFLGQLAFQELMTDSSVKATFESVIQYIDEEKFNKEFSKK